MGKKVQIGSSNTASGTDRVAVQAGQVGGKSSKSEQPTPPTSVRSENVRTGNATVGHQVDEIHGGFTIRR